MKLFRSLRFTMIELLLVIAIIVILAGMLLPALSRAKDMSKQIQCSGNLRNIGIGMAAYRGDYAGFMPDENEWGTWTWFKQLGPVKYYSGLGYLDNIAVFHCPSNEEFYKYFLGPSYALYKYKDSYSLNYDISLASEVKISQPTKAVVLLDGYAEDEAIPMTPVYFTPGYPTRLSISLIPNSGSCKVGFFHQGRKKKIGRAHV